MNRKILFFNITNPNSELFRIKSQVVHLIGSKGKISNIIFLNNASLSTIIKHIPGLKYLQRSRLENHSESNTNYSLFNPVIPRFTCCIKRAVVLSICN